LVLENWITNGDGPGSIHIDAVPVASPIRSCT